jgi:hypothetical protein
MEKRQERADKGQPRKPDGNKRKHNWQVLLTDDENAIIDNYLKKEGIDKAFFMRRAMLKAVPRTFRILDQRTLPGEPLEVPPTPDPAPVVASSTPRQPVDPPITVVSPIIVAQKAPELPVNAPISEKQAPEPTKPKKAPKPPKSLPFMHVRLSKEQKDAADAAQAAGLKELGLD